MVCCLSNLWQLLPAAVGNDVTFTLLLQDAEEYAELPVRHNEDQLNADLALKLPMEVNKFKLDDSHVKAYILLQAHLSRCPLPSSDYLTDTKSVMDQAIRVLQVHKLL